MPRFNSAPRASASDDRGAYAILFALVVVVLVSMVAFVIDLAMIREDRARTRSAIDSAVTASAGLLNGGGADGNPQAACQKAWEYLAQSIGGLEVDSGACSSLPTTIGTCPSTSTAYSGGADPFQVNIYWPVPDSSDLMTSPDTAPAFPSQVINADVDGVDPCSRIGIEVKRTNQTFFAGVVGVGETTTRSASVARSVNVPGNGIVVAALNILHKKDCEVLRTTGGGSIIVGKKDSELASGEDPRPGIVSVDSEGLTGCGGGKRVIAPADVPGTGIWAFGTGAQIQSYAMAVNPSKAFLDTGAVLGTSEDAPDNLWPRPTERPVQFGRLPVDLFYNCTGGMDCSEGGGGKGGNYIQPFASAYNPSSFSRAAAEALGFTIWDNCGGPSGTDSDELILGASVFIDCPDLQVKTTLALPDAEIVVSRGGINVGNGGCFVLNAPSADPPTCPTIESLSSIAATKDAKLYIQSGNLTQSSDGGLYLRNTFTYLRDGSTSFQAGSDGGSLLMTAPACAVPAGTSCQYENFDKLALWSEKTTRFEYTGGANQLMLGVLFTPNGETKLNGQTGTDQIFAQFWTLTLWATGGSAVRMDVDEDYSVPLPAFGGALIR